MEPPDFLNTTVVILKTLKKYDFSITKIFENILLLSYFLIGLLLLSLSFQTTAYASDNFESLAHRCAPSIAIDTLKALVKTESNFNPYAIGVVGSTVKQPKSFSEAMFTIAQLENQKKNYSVGIAQINKSNFKKYGINAEKALDACTNLKVASEILTECFNRANNGKKTEKSALKDALSCYYSGNFKTGYEHGYVNKVEMHASPTVSVPSIILADDNIVSVAKSPPASASKLIF